MDTSSSPTTMDSSVSRRKFLNLSALTLMGGALVSTSRVWATVPVKTPTKAATIMPQTEGTFGVAPLPYAYDALEPTIDRETMYLHHDKHYATYTKNLNKALSEAPELKSKSITELLSNISALPTSVRKTIRNNGGGYYNHSLFWQWMTPNGDGAPDGPLSAAIDKTFGSFSAMREQLNKEAASIFGSGWAWLIVRDNGGLEITSTSNQDNPLMKGIAESLGKPVLGLDVWEHSYYLKYKNERPKYIAAWWKVVNWKTASSLYAAANSSGI
jgi:Fe-Mn family superoxide dismutase